MQATGARGDLPPPVVVSAMPTTRELVAAMSGVVPASRPACVILHAAFLLASMDDRIAPDIMINLINRAATDARLGPAVHRLAWAWRDYQRTTGDNATPGGLRRHEQATAAVIAARAAYTRLRRTITTSRASAPLLNRQTSRHDH